MTAPPCPHEPEAMRLGAHEIGPELQAHLDECGRCRAHADDNKALSELAQMLPWDAPDPDRAEQLRTKLLAEAPRVLPDAPRVRGDARREQPDAQRVQPDARAAASASRRVVVLSAVAAAAAAVLLWMGLRGTPQDGSQVPHVALRPAAGAVYTDLDTSQDRIVRLTEGSLLIEVEKLSAEQRVRVVTSDAEVEVRGTSFDVVAKNDRLVSVWVLHGKVEVRRRNSAPLLLAQGDRWEAAPTAPKALAAATERGAKKEQPRAVAPPAQTGASADTSSPQPQSAGEQRPLAHAVAPNPAPDKAREEDPSEAAFREGWKALKSGNTQAAESAFARAEKAPTSAVSEDARFWRAVALSRAGKKPQAIAAFRAFIAAHPHSARRGEASTLLGRLLLESGQHAAARERFLDAQHDARPEVKRAAESGLADSKDDASRDKP